MINKVSVNGRLHIANDAHYQGSINSYDNLLTKFFSKLFHLSQDIKINNETHTLNKKSYKKFLKSINIDKSTCLISNYKDFNKLSPSFATDRGFMRNHITNKKSNKLGLELINSIIKDDTNNTKRLIAQGALIDQHFWIYNNQIHSEFSQHWFKYGKVSPSRVDKFTPLLYAAQKNNSELVSILEDYGVDKELKGATFNFQRDIEEILPNVSVINIKFNDAYSDYKEIHYDKNLKNPVENKNFLDRKHNWTFMINVHNGRRCIIEN